MAIKANEVDDSTVDTGKDGANVTGGAGGDDTDAKLTKLVNSAVSTHLKRQMGKLGESFGSMLDEKLAALGHIKAPKEPDGDGGTANGKAPIKPKDDDADDVRKELNTLRAELKAEKTKQREREVFVDVKSLLVGKVRPESIETAMKLIKHDGKIVIKANGTVLYRGEDGDVSLEDGIAEWLSGSEASVFVPAPAPSRVAAKKPTYGAKVPQRGGNGNGGGEENLTSAQRANAMLQKKGLSLS